MLEKIERAYRHRLAPPIVAGALLAALDVPLVSGVFAIVLFVVVIEAVKQAAREGAAGNPWRDNEAAVREKFADTNIIKPREDKPDGL